MAKKRTITLLKAYHRWYFYVLYLLLLFLCNMVVDKIALSKWFLQTCNCFCHAHFIAILWHIKNQFVFPFFMSYHTSTFKSKKQAYSFVILASYIIQYFYQTKVNIIIKIFLQIYIKKKFTRV